MQQFNDRQKQSKPEKKSDFYDRLPPGVDVLLPLALGAALLAFWYFVEFKLGILSIILGLIGFIGLILRILKG